jgi:hypothetical protein
MVVERENRLRGAIVDDLAGRAAKCAERAGPPTQSRTPTGTAETSASTTARSAPPTTGTASRQLRNRAGKLHEQYGRCERADPGGGERIPARLRGGPVATVQRIRTTNCGSGRHVGPGVQRTLRSQLPTSRRDFRLTGRRCTPSRPTATPTSTYAGSSAIRNRSRRTRDSDKHSTS